MIIEAIVQHSKEIVEAAYGKADRVELVSHMQHGGLTPDAQTLKDALLMSFVPVHVMVRPHDDSFIYTEADQEIMLQTIALIDTYKGKNIVIGALKEDLRIDTDFLERVIESYPHMNITFHRAFDRARDVFEAYDTLCHYPQVKWILTSGGHADCMGGKDNLKRLVQKQKAQAGPIIMPGSGLNLENINALHQHIQADAYHFGKAVRLQQSFDHGFDQSTLKQLKTILK